MFAVPAVLSQIPDSVSREASCQEPSSLRLSAVTEKLHLGRGNTQSFLHGPTYDGRTAAPGLVSPEVPARGPMQGQVYSTLRSCAGEKLGWLTAPQPASHPLCKVESTRGQHPASASPWHRAYCALHACHTSGHAAEQDKDPRGEESRPAHTTNNTGHVCWDGVWMCSQGSSLEVWSQCVTLGDFQKRKHGIK